LNFAPKPFDIVEIPLLRCEDVNDHVAEIDQDPGSIVVALDSLGGESVVLGVLDDAVGNGARLDFRPARYDGEGIGEDRSGAYVDGDKIVAFLFFGGDSNDVDQVSDGVLPSAWRRVRSTASVFGATSAPVRSRYSIVA
jgi:hypothetical protein